MSAPCCGDQLVGVDDVAEVLAHLAAVGDDHLVEEAAGEGLAVLEEGEGADVAQRLGHDALVEDEAAAVVAGDEALGRAATACRSGWVNICSARSSGGTAAGTQSQSASKWQSRVSVSRLAAPPQRGHSTSTKSGRSASGLPSPVGSMSRGRTTGRSSTGTGTGPQLSQLTIGIGVPQ